MKTFAYTTYLMLYFMNVLTFLHMSLHNYCCVDKNTHLGVASLIGL